MTDLSTLHYSEEHEWIAADGSVVTVGITDYAAEKLGDVVFVELPAVGTEVTAGAVVGEIESTKSVSDVFAPVDGTVVSVNAELEDAPEQVNAEPYGSGWMVDLECATADAAEAAWDALMTADQYAAGLS